MTAPINGGRFLAVAVAVPGTGRHRHGATLVQHGNQLSLGKVVSKLLVEA